MQEILLRFQNDSTLLLIAGISLVILLVIVLIVVIFSTKIKTLSDKLWDSNESHKTKNIKIEILEKELQVLKIRNASNEQELQQFAETKGILGSKEELLATIRGRYNELKKEQTQTKAKLESIESMYANLLLEHKSLQSRNESLTEENSRYRINNARLLTKLETEARHASAKLKMTRD